MLIDTKIDSLFHGFMSAHVLYATVVITRVSTSELWDMD